MNWLSETFKPYCEKQGIELLKDDLKFIEKSLGRIIPSNRKRLMVVYVEKWIEGMLSCKSQTVAQNTGRKRANLWLLEQVYDTRES